MTETLTMAAKERAAAITLENKLSDIFDLVKITHQIAVNKDNAMSPYDGDADAALFSSVSFLREKTAEFEGLYYAQPKGAAS